MVKTLGCGPKDKSSILFRYPKIKIMKEIIFYIVFYTLTAQVECPKQKDVFGRSIKTHINTLGYKKCYDEFDYIKKMSQEQLNEAVRIDSMDEAVKITRIDTIKAYVVHNDTLIIK